MGARDALHGHDPGPPTPQPELFSLYEEEPGGTRPDRLSDVRPQERVQRCTVEQLVDSPPVVPSLDAPVPLMAEQLVDVLSLVAKYEKEMDRIETGRLGVAGSTTPPLPPVQRGRRRGGRGNCRKRQQWVAPFSDVLEAFVMQETVDIPQLQFIDKLGVVPVGARGVPVPQTMDAVEEIPLVRFFVEQIVVCQFHRSWRFWSCRRSLRKSWR